ncbi:hypothetical protein KFK09_026506 [Dendrobium nobile]|uniref:Bulb-type lectin domain-containing protein n=1 Tax=Dendrobium nobile TaxID=94219 RepID=A0A8T3A703_DENNO|nr:hypothetical protein KFK09_026506 [Dendrobium nobile]
MAFSFSSAITVLPLLFTTVLLIISHFSLPAYAISSLKSGQWLRSGKSLVNAGYSFTMNQDCSLVLYDSNKQIIWSTRTQGMDFGCNLKLQHDGNLVMYNTIGNMIWSTKTNKNTWKIYQLVLRADHSVVIKDENGHIIWDNELSILSP